MWKKLIYFYFHIRILTELRKLKVKAKHEHGSKMALSVFVSQKRIVGYH